jgi:Kef-type K+ transport system membrane component KefB
VTADQAGTLLLCLAIVLVLARLFGAAARRIGQPPVVGEIVAGILAGPTLFHGAVADALFPTDLRPYLAALANIGLVLFMFIVGYELDHTLLRGKERIAVSVSVGSIVFPFGLGAVLALYLLRSHPTEHELGFVLFLGAAMSVTAFPVLARILTDRSLHRTALGGLALASAAVDDLLAWSLLAVVVAVAGAGGADQWHALLAVPYVVLMVGVVRPVLRRLVAARDSAGRLTSGVLAVILVGLLLSCWAAEWLGVHFIFGAFLFGAVMPRTGGAQLRQEVLERLEQVSVLLLLPVFFVVAGLAVDLSAVGLAGLGELALILLTAISGKFAGAYLGARLQRVPVRQSAVLATLMNTRGLTEIVILTVGLQLGVLDGALFSLMVVMALVTTVMAGPLLGVLYPRRRIERDVAEAERAALGAAAAYRVAVVVSEPAAAAPRVELGLDLLGRQRPAELVLCHLRAYTGPPSLEVGCGLTGELLEMTRTMGELEVLAGQARGRGVAAPVLSRFTDDVARDLPGQLASTRADLVLVDTGEADAFTGQVVTVNAVPAGPTAVVLHWATSADGRAAAQVAARIAASRELELVVASGSRRAAALAAELSGHGITARAGSPPGEGALVVAPDGVAGAHLLVRAGSGVEPPNWAGILVPAPA